MLKRDKNKNRPSNSLVNLEPPPRDHQRDNSIHTKNPSVSNKIPISPAKQRQSNSTQEEGIHVNLSQGSINEHENREIYESFK